jgi:hypothetical protein
MLLTLKECLSALLLLSVTILALTPMAGSQSITTITSLTTATRQTTSTSYSTAAVGTTTATSTVTSAIFSLTTLTVDAAKPRTCYIRSFPYDGLAGEKLQGKWTSNYVINFYVMSESNFAKYKYCGEPGSTYVTVEMATSYSLSWVVPANERLRFIFENYATGSDLASARTVSFELYLVGQQSSTSMLYSTTSAQLILKSTVTLTSVSYSTIHSPLEGITSPAPLAAIGVIVGILIVIALVTIPKRQKRAAGTKKPSDVPTGKSFCINCGAELQTNSKFCNKCGSAQTQ